MGGEEREESEKRDRREWGESRMRKKGRGKRSETVGEERGDRVRRDGESRMREEIEEERDTVKGERREGDE